MEKIVAADLKLIAPMVKRAIVFGVPGNWMMYVDLGNDDHRSVITARKMSKVYKTLEAAMSDLSQAGLYRFEVHNEENEPAL